MKDPWYDFEVGVKMDGSERGNYFIFVSINFGRTGPKAEKFGSQIQTESHKTKLGLYNKIFSNMHVQNHCNIHIGSDSSNIYLYMPRVNMPS